MEQRLRTILIEYLLAKVGQEDWHAVSDAANDLRELDARISAKKELELERARNLREMSDQLQAQVFGQDSYTEKCSSDPGDYQPLNR